MAYRFLEDIALADIAYEVRARTLERLFADAAEALLKVQIENLDQVRRAQKQTIELYDAKIDMLLYNFLQELVYLKDATRLLLLADQIQINKQDSFYALKALVSGEPLDANRHEQRVDVKAVTLHRFEVAQTPSGWKATVVLDI